MNVNDPDLKGASTGPAPTDAVSEAGSATPRPDATSTGRAAPPPRSPGGYGDEGRPVAAARPSGGGRALGWLALAVSVLAFVASFYTWQRADRVGREAARRLQETEGKITQIDQQFKVLQDQSRDLIGRSAVQENKLGEMSEQQAQLERLYRNFAADTLDSVLADTEVAVSIASQQLQVAGNVHAALAALQDAENHLKRADAQAVASLHRLVSRDIDRLRAVPQVDIAAISQRLDTLMASLGQWPMLSGETPPGQDNSPPPAVPTAGAAEGSMFERLADTGRRGWESLKNELMQLIRVNRIDDPQAALMAPEQRYFARENLRLSLLSARLALLARNESVLQSDLSHAIDWLNRYYDTQNRAVANAIDSLKQIQQHRIANDLPSLADTLTAVRAQRAAREASR